MESINVDVKASYRGYEIEFVEHRNAWRIKGETSYESFEIKKVKDYIDKLLKGNFVPIKAIRIGWRDDVSEITITSIDNSDPKSVWVINSEGKRSKESKSRLYAITKENLSKIEQTKDISKQVEELNKKIGSINSSLTLAID